MTLHLYFARRFLWAFLGVFGVFGGIVLLIDIAEQLRRFGGKDIGLSRIVGLSALNVPETIYQILPLITILATLTLFLALARSGELVVTRAAGRSALRALVAPLILALVIGAFAVAAFNPIVAATQKEYEDRSNALAGGEARILSISDEGLWLRQGDETGQTVIHARTANLDGTRLVKARFVVLTPDGLPKRRIEAETATLVEGAWEMRNVKSWPLAGSDNPERDAEYHDRLLLPSDLTREQIRDSFGAPGAIAIWDLPDFIASLDRAGFSARSHRVWFQMELALPVMLAAMVLIAAGFTMRHTRPGRSGLMVLFALLLGFGLYFIRNFARILGENGQIPVTLAAWAPPVAAILLSLGLLLHLEDG